MFSFVEPDCSQAVLQERRRNPDYDILANDCYILNSFLNSEKENIAKIFNQSKLRTIQEQNSQCELSDKNGNCNNTDFKLKFSELVVSVMELANGRGERTVMDPNKKHN